MARQSFAHFVSQTPTYFIGCRFLIAIQSYCLYSAVARLPVALALLGFNTYPLWIALWARLLYKHRPEPAVLRVMPIMLIGLALALDVLGATSGLGAQGQWAVIGEGVFFCISSSGLVWYCHGCDTTRSR